MQIQKFQKHWLLFSRISNTLLLRKKTNWLYFFLFFNSLFAQNIDIKINNPSQKELIKIIERQTSYKFAFIGNKDNFKWDVNFNFKQIPVKYLLQYLNYHSSFKYTIQGHNIIIEHKNEPNKDNKVCTITVLDESKRPLPDILIKSDYEYNYTNALGQCKFFKFSDTKKITIASSLVINDIIIDVQDKNEYTVQLENTSFVIEPVVVPRERKLQHLEITPEKNTLKLRNNKELQARTLFDIFQQLPAVFVTEGGQIFMGTQELKLYINSQEMQMTGSDIISFLKDQKGADFEELQLFTNPTSQFDVLNNFGVLNLVIEKNLVQKQLALNSTTDWHTGRGYAQSTTATYNGYAGKWDWAIRLQNQKGQIETPNAYYFTSAEDRDNDITLKVNTLSNEVPNSNSYHASLGFKPNESNNFFMQYKGLEKKNKYISYNNNFSNFSTEIFSNEIFNQNDQLNTNNLLFLYKHRFSKNQHIDLQTNYNIKMQSIYGNSDVFKESLNSYYTIAFENDIALKQYFVRTNYYFQLNMIDTKAICGIRLKNSKYLDNNSSNFYNNFNYWVINELKFKTYQLSSFIDLNKKWNNFTFKGSISWENYAMTNEKLVANKSDNIDVINNETINNEKQNINRLFTSLLVEYRLSDKRTTSFSYSEKMIIPTFDLVYKNLTFNSSIGVENIGNTSVLVATTKNWEWKWIHQDRLYFSVLYTQYKNNFLENIAITNVSNSFADVNLSQSFIQIEKQKDLTFIGMLFFKLPNFFNSQEIPKSDNSVTNNRINIGVSYKQQQFNTSNYLYNTTNHLVGFNIQLNYIFPKQYNFSAQWHYVPFGRINQQEIISPMNRLSFQLQKSIFKNKLQCQLMLTNPFGLYRQNVRGNQETFSIRYNFLPPTTLQLGLFWKIGL